MANLSYSGASESSLFPNENEETKYQSRPGIAACGLRWERPAIGTLADTAPVREDSSPGHRPQEPSAPCSRWQRPPPTVKASRTEGHSGPSSRGPISWAEWPRELPHPHPSQPGCPALRAQGGTGCRPALAPERRARSPSWPAYICMLLACDQPRARSPPLAPCGWAAPHTLPVRPGARAPAPAGPRSRAPSGGSQPIEAAD